MTTTALRKNLEFWHWFPELIVSGLDDEQVAWQPDGHDTSTLFALWHTYRAEDELLHSMVMRQPSVYTRDGWAERMPVSEKGLSPFGNGMTREQISRVRPPIAEVLAYAKAVGASVIDWLATADEEELRAEVKLPFFTGVYQGVDAMSKLETIAFFSIGHNSEHLGEAQMLKGMMGLKGAPL
jgi:hypothetical protein